MGRAAFWVLALTAGVWPLLAPSPPAEAAGNQPSPAPAAVVYHQGALYAYDIHANLVAPTGVAAGRVATYERPVGNELEVSVTFSGLQAPRATSLADDAVTTGRTASTSWGRTIDDFQQHGDQWRRVSAHAEGATGRAYRGGTSIEEVFERGGDRLVRHRIYGPNGEVLHETFRPYAKFGAP